MYYIGIDFGHGETSASYVSDKDDNVKQLALRRSSRFEDKKVYSAICRDKNGEWRFVSSPSDLKSYDFREGFKGIVSKLNETNKEALREFGKLIFKAICENNSEDLHYDPETGEANFVISIANPSDWRRQDPTFPKEYLDFFRNEAGIKQVHMCINESDAAFYTKYNKNKEDNHYNNIFVIDLGSSTIDFTTYNNNKCNKECCWGAELGAHWIENRIYEYAIYEDENCKENRDNVAKVCDLRSKLSGCESDKEKEEIGVSVESSLRLIARMVKEHFFTNHPDGLEYEPKFHELIAGYGSKDNKNDKEDIDRKDEKLTDRIFEMYLSKDKFEDIIHDYVSQLELTLHNAKEKLEGHSIVPELIVLSGGASRMSFVEKLVEKEFPDANIILDNNPEWVVSNGAALYAKVQYKAKQDRDALVKDFETWAKENLDGEMCKAAVSTFNSVIKEMLASGLETDFIQSGNGSLNELEQKTCSILEKAGGSFSFKQKADKAFMDIVDGKIKSQLQKIIKERYDKNVEIRESFIDPGDTFANVMVHTEFIHDFIAEIGNIYCNNFFFESKEDLSWSKERDPDTRKKMVNSLLEVTSYDEFNHNIDMKVFIEQAKAKIDKTLNENGLFQISETATLL